jgi:hypothetical protein
MERSVRTQNDAEPVGKDADVHSKVSPIPSPKLVVMSPGLNDGTNSVYLASEAEDVPKYITPLLLVYESCPFENVSTAALVQSMDDWPEAPKKVNA